MLMSAGITYKLMQRMWPGERKGCVAVVYVWLVVFIISSLLFTFTGLFAERVYGMVTKPKYEATIVAVSSHKSEDTDGRRTTLYTPTVSFKDRHQQQRTVETHISTSGRQTVGDHIKISYGPGDSMATALSGSRIRHDV